MSSFTPGSGRRADAAATTEWRKPRFYAIRRSWETQEAYWFWTLGKWEVSAGLFKGFGLGFSVQRDEWDLTLGPFSIGGIRE